MSDAVIRVKGAVRRFGDVVALDGVDLEVLRGRVLALLGPSGCGKTTLLRLIAGFERPDEGLVEIDGATVAGPGAWVPPEARRVGMVFQDYALFPHLSVAANVGFGLLRRRSLPVPLRRRARGSDRERIGEVLALVGLDGLGDRAPHQLSGGQQQRVALARALAPEPSVVLLDEPFSNLDAALRAQVRAEVARILRAAGATAVVVTHDQEEALSVADEVAVMGDGRVAQHAPPEELYTAPRDRRVAAFVGEADFLPGTAAAGGVATELGMLPLADRAFPDGTALEVLLRPEDLHLHADDEGVAEVVERTFYGHDQVLAVRVASGRVLRVRLGPVTPLRPGDRCTVSVPAPVRAFAAAT